MRNKTPPMQDNRSNSTDTSSISEVVSNLVEGESVKIQLVSPDLHETVIAGTVNETDDDYYFSLTDVSTESDSVDAVEFVQAIHNDNKFVATGRPVDNMHIHNITHVDSDSANGSVL